jgi:hypothetical protein
MIFVTYLVHLSANEVNHEVPAGSVHSDHACTRLDAANAMPYYRNATSRLGILASPDKPCDRIRSESSVIAPSETATERNI